VGELALVLGGVRSGKSRWAEQLAASRPPVTYLATAQAGDEEMARRIAEHKKRRPGEWQTVEEPWDLPGVVRRHRDGSLLIECLTLWLSNMLVGIAGQTALDDNRVRTVAGDLLTAIGEASGRIIVVSSEVGSGIVPANTLARRFADLLGETNQRLAALATEVYLCVAGIPVPIKGRAP
jgi:adenosyl cobinamide kinase/adenosyl cobinamide phosphate guanylyltransferase